MAPAPPSGLPDPADLITSLLAAHSAQQGTPLDALLAEFAVMSTRPNETISSKLIGLLEAAARALKDDGLGFHLATQADLRQLGLIQYLLTSAATLGDALSIATRIGPAVFEAIMLRLERSSDAVALRFEYEGAERHRDRHLIEFWATILMRSLRQAAESDVTPVQAGFTHRREDPPEEMTRVFGPRLTFAAAIDGLVFDPRTLDLPLAGADAFLHDVLVHQLDAVIAARDPVPAPFRIRIENAISPRLPQGGVSIGVVAKELGMSVRTLSRRLAEEKTSFSKVLAGVRTDLALTYIEDPLLPMSRIAWLLGYKDASAFIVAFRRWTGMSPSEARARRQRTFA
jgi:AraC-like DNA-binding protein